MNETQTTHKTHTSPAQYVLIGVILCGLTALEIILYYSENTFGKAFVVTSLLILAATKFILVAGFFMHLKDDQKVFRRWFIIAGITVLLLFTAVLTTLSFQDHRFF